jgi:hypothetical protein
VEAGWADVRPNDHDHPGLSRVLPCTHCDHDEHVTECEALVDDVRNVYCPCRGVPVPGIYPLPQRTSRFPRT